MRSAALWESNPCWLLLCLEVVMGPLRRRTITPPVTATKWCNLAWRLMWHVVHEKTTACWQDCAVKSSEQSQTICCFSIRFFRTRTTARALCTLTRSRVRFAQIRSSRRFCKTTDGASLTTLFRWGIDHGQCFSEAINFRQLFFCIFLPIRSRRKSKAFRLASGRGFRNKPRFATQWSFISQQSTDLSERLREVPMRGCNWGVDWNYKIDRASGKNTTQRPL